MLDSQARVGQSVTRWTFRHALDSEARVGQSGTRWTVSYALDSQARVGQSGTRWTVRATARLYHSTLPERLGGIQDCVGREEC